MPNREYIPFTGVTAGVFATIPSPCSSSPILGDGWIFKTLPGPSPNSNLSPQPTEKELFNS